MNNGAAKIIKDVLIGLLAVALIFTMTFTSRVTALDEGLDVDTAVDKVVEAIDNIPAIDDLKRTDREKVEYARSEYNDLQNYYGEALQSDEISDETSSKLETAYGTLVAAENRIKELQEQYISAIKKEALAVVAKIKKIPARSKLKLKHSTLVNRAKNAYGRLNKAEKNYLTTHYPKTYKKLQKAVSKIAQLKRTVRIAKLHAAKVTKLIRKIPAVKKIKYKHKKRINKAYKAFKKLEKSERKYVPKSKRSKLTKAVKKIKRLDKKVKAFRKSRPSLKLYTSGRLDIKVAWKKVKNAKKYIIYRKTGKKFHKIKVTSKRSFTDKNRFRTSKNIYRVKAITTIGGKKIRSKYSKSKNKVLLKKSVIVKATAYSGGGHCANGMPAAVGRVAVDPRYIPLGTWLYVEGYGLCQACDTGGAVKGWFVDVYFNSNAQCNRWGVKHPRTYILR